MVTEISPVVWRCVECGRSWTWQDDPNEYQYGHDCEV